MNVSEQLLEFLKNEQVSEIFGVAGDALNPLVNAIGNQDQISWVPVNHEGNGSYAAFAQGLLGDTVGVCASTVGPGALHLVNGLYNAKKARSSVVVITGQIPVHNLRTDYHQEVDLIKVFDDVCDYQAIIRSPEQAPKLIARALNIALNNNCVCRIELPADIAQMPATSDAFVKPVLRSSSTLVPDIETVNTVAELINSANKVGVLAGVGCRSARENVIELADKIDAPITHSLKAGDIFDKSIPHVVGLNGLIGNPSGYKGLNECDILLLLGTDFPYSDFLPEETTSVQVDFNIENIGMRTPVDIGVHADINAFLKLLLPKINTKERGNWLRNLRSDYLEWKDQMSIKSLKIDSKPPSPMTYAAHLNRIASDDALFIIDTGTSAIWASNCMDFHSDRRIIGSFNHGSMAVGLPAAMGAQLLFPNREVWVLMGDGAFNMCLQDLKTIAKLNLPVKFVVFNNSELSFVKIEMEEAGLKPNLDALHVDNIDFAAYARLCGGGGANVEDACDIEKVLQQAKQSQQPFVINGFSNAGELSLPPRITPKQAYHFGSSKAKELLAAIKGEDEQWANLKNELTSFVNQFV